MLRCIFNTFQLMWHSHLRMNHDFHSQMRMEWQVRLGVECTGCAVEVTGGFVTPCFHPGQGSRAWDGVRKATLIWVAYAACGTWQHMATCFLTFKHNSSFHSLPEHVWWLCALGAWNKSGNLAQKGHQNGSFSKLLTFLTEFTQSVYISHLAWRGCVSGVPNWPFDCPEQKRGSISLKSCCTQNHSQMRMIQIIRKWAVRAA